MDSQSLMVAIGSAFWLGILTSISPCPLATNIAAIAYISRTIKHPFYVLLNGLLYTLGRSLAYLAIGLILIRSLLSTPELAMALQTYINQWMGPLLIVVGLILLELVTLPSGSGSWISKMQSRIEKLGLVGAFLLGVLFALSFCPVSAALFFGSLIPLALSYQSGLTLPAVYGVGTAVPVIGFAFLLAFGFNRLGAAFNRVSVFEKWARRITAVLFILAGVYFTWIFLIK